jgi:glycosyltransferase involved in cell wall biosynthesis
MKVGCISNMNNNNFSLVRYLRDRGVDAHLLLTNTEQLHFLPECDTFDFGHEAFVRQLSWGDIKSFTTPKAAIQADLEEYEVLFGSGTTPAYLDRIGRRLDVFTPHGSDIFCLPFLRNIRPSRYLARNINLTLHQMQGIRKARNIFLCPTDDEYAKRISSIQYNGNRHYAMITAVYTPMYNPHEITRYYGKTPSYEQFRAIREQFELVVFHHTRHMWTNARECSHTKGNDILVRGFAQFIKSNKSCNAALVMFKYGDDYHHTLQLTRELGIEKNVRWFSVLPRKEIMVGLSMCDLSSNEFHDGCIGGAAAMEAMALAKPILQYRNDEMNLLHFPELSPTLNVRSPDEISDVLCDAVRRPEHYKAIGEAGLAWHQRFCIDRSLSYYMDVIQANQK